MHVKPFSEAFQDWSYAGAAIANTSDVALKAAAGANTKAHLTGLQFINTSATATTVVVKDGATVIWRGAAPASMANMCNVQFDVPLRSSNNAALNFACEVTAANVYVNAQGYVE